MSSIHPDSLFSGPNSSLGSESRYNRSLLTSDGVQDLRDAMQWSTKALEPFQRNYKSTIKLYAGSRYGNSTSKEENKTALNMLRLAVNVWMRQLAAKTPKCLVLTDSPDLKTSAYELEIAIEHLLQEINFGRSLGHAVLSAIFGMGILKVGITNDYLAEGTNYLSEAGQPYADPVLYEDWLHDMNAQRIEEWDWCGNRYRVPYEQMMNNKEFDKDTRARMHKPKLSERNNYDYMAQGYNVRTNELSSRNAIMQEEYTPTVELWDIWIPRNKVMVTLPAQQGLDALQVRDWDGPRHGMFHIFGFTNIPGNIVPGSPAQDLHEIQSLISLLFNKLGEQAIRQKTNVFADSRSESDGTAENAIQAADGEVIPTSSPDSLKEVRWGGPDQQNMAFLEWIRGLASYLGGNIDSLGGLAQQADTLGQERLLAQSSSELVRDMQSKVIAVTNAVVKDLAWYLYTDPLIELPLVKRIKGFGDINFDYGPDRRQGEFFNYNFRIKPHTLQDKGPGERLQMIMTLVKEFFLPLAPQLEQHGMKMDFSALVGTIAKYADLPEIEDFLQSDQPIGRDILNAAGKPKSERLMQSPVTSRNYTRTNIKGGGTEDAKRNDFMQTLLKGGNGDGK